MKILFVYPSRNGQIGFNCGGAFRYNDFTAADSSWSD